MPPRLIALALLLISCGGRIGVEDRTAGPVPGGGPIVPVWIDYRLTTEELEETNKAIDQWNQSLNGNMQYQVVSDDFDFWPEVLRDINNGLKGIVILRQPRCDPGGGGWIDNIYGPYVHVCPLGPSIIRPIVLHELGHGLGLTHVTDNADSLMYGTVNPRMCIDQETVDQLANKHPEWFGLKVVCP